MIRKKPKKPPATYVYIAGPMTGIKNLNRPAFRAAAKRLRSLGFRVVNPHELKHDKSKAELAAMDADQLWHFFMYLCIHKIGLHQLEACVYLPESSASRGATSERLLFATLELPEAAYTPAVGRKTYERRFRESFAHSSLYYRIHHLAVTRLHQLSKKGHRHV